MTFFFKKPCVRAFSLAAAGWSLCALLLPAANAHAQSRLNLSENFDDATILVREGFRFYNNSNPAPSGNHNWFQGNSSTFASQSGAANSYIAANYASTGGRDSSGDTISNWMLTPVVSLQNGTTVSFYSRTTTTDRYPDRLEVRYSLNGDSTNIGSTATSVGDFSTLLMTINPTLQAGSSYYPNTWTQYSLTLSGLADGVTATGRLGFRYSVTNAGMNGSNSDYIGVDSLFVHTDPATPEPVSLAYLFAGAGIAGGKILTRRQRQTVSAH